MGNSVVTGVKLVVEDSIIRFESELNNAINNINELYKVLDVDFNIKNDVRYVAIIKYGYILKH